MSKNMIPKPGHIMYQTSSDIRDIAKPLDEYLKIKEFTYEKIYNNNQKVKLTNQPEWMSYFYANNFHLLGGDDTVDNLPAGINFTSSMVSENGDSVIFDSCKSFFNIGDGILYVENYESYREVFWFTSDESNHYLRNYQRSIELLQIFAKSFKDQARRIIKNAEYEKIVRPAKSQDVAQNQLQGVDETGFLSAVMGNTKKFRFCHQKKEVVLTQRELQCAVGLLTGHSASEIADERQRSVRTIEAQIDSLKAKLQVFTRSGLIQALAEMGVGIYIGRCDFRHQERD